MASMRSSGVNWKESKMAQKKDGSPDNTFRDLATIGSLLAIILAIVWFKARYIIIKPIFWLFWIEYHLAKIFHPIFATLHILPFTAGTLKDYQYNYEIISNMISSQSVSMTDIGLVSSNVGRYIGAISIMMAVILFPIILKYKGKPAPRRTFMIKGYKYKKLFKSRFFSTTNAKAAERWIKVINLLSKLGIKIKYTYDFEKVTAGNKSFVHYQSQKWRTAITSAMFDPDRADPRWDPQMTDVDFCLANGITNIDDESTEEKLTRALTKQIGKRIDSIEKFPTHARAILALCWLNKTRKRGQGEALAGDFAEICLPHDTLDHYRQVSEPKMRALADKILDKAATEFFNETLSRFYGWRTAMVAMYSETGPNEKWGGGKSGVLASATFLWVKGIDRTLWYALNNVGMRRYHVEGIGPIAQFEWERFNEKTSGHPVHVEGAVRGIIKEVKIKGITDLKSYMRDIERQQS